MIRAIRVWLWLPVAILVCVFLISIIVEGIKKLIRWLKLRKEYRRLRKEDMKTTLKEIEEYERKQKSKKSGGDEE